MKSHTINILKLCRHSGIANHSIAHSITLIKKELKACIQSFFIFSPNDSPYSWTLNSQRKLYFFLH